jgi:hypothetical protein
VVSWYIAQYAVLPSSRSQESGPQVSASPGPCQPRRERSASPVRPIGPALADLHRARPGKAQTAQDPQPPKPRGTAGGPRDARSASESFGLSGTSRFASNRHTAGHVQVDPPSHPPNPPRNLFPWPGYHIRNGSSCSSTRVNFEFRPSGSRSLEQAQPSLVASRHTLRGPAARQGEEPIPSHKCDGREAIPGRGRNESTTWTTRTTHAPNFWFRPVPGLHQRTQWQADALAVPGRWKHLSSPLVPHPQSYIKVVDPPPNLSFSPFQPHSFWSSILPVTVFCPPSF